MDYLVKRTKRKSVSISIDENGVVKVFAPFGVPNIYIEELIDENKNWIDENLENIKRKKMNKKQWTFKEGMTVPFLGKDYNIKFIIGNFPKNYIRFYENTFQFELNKKIYDDSFKRIEICKDLLKDFYKKEGNIYLKRRTKELEKIIGVKSIDIRVKDVKTIWGSCSSKNNINYNLRLMMMDKNFIDYVIIHELCHLLHRNHSKAFWNEVFKYCNDYRKIRNDIKEVGFYYNTL
ncbi:M48 family metallopeptidase [Clostridium fallax]|uniref:YgjP-like metallopeptidase domain-containing protein n=1 Tax=Clostridium fallax TaxID=1533 RepID=A0A1M4T956_9CLOT|nr:SprT family zinc-dependent metalloprotease [Clostridium fallax]SHE40904.1 hypothetical protein SAMN05443638_10276 [Clostridium fallax]SQB22654.1 putative metal-dependent hydrolase [Clostridium fallax]